MGRQTGRSVHHLLLLIGRSEAYVRPLWMELKSDCASESFSPAGILFLRRGCLLKDYEYLDGILIFTEGS